MELRGGPIAAAGDGTIQAQGGRLGDPRLQTAQRQALAAQIGRVQGNHIVLSDETCSAQHARIRVEVQKDETGQPSAPAFMLYDMGSRNGTYVGDRETYRNEENRKYRYELQDGDFILIGETTLAFKKL